MKKIRITVNGKVYDCVVEVLEEDDQVASPSRAEAPSPPPPAPVNNPAPAAPSGNNGNGNGSDVRSPLGGTVQRIFVSPGSAIEEKAPMVLLDAMKMDTYIYAPRTGVVDDVCTKVGDTVQVGQVLVRYRS